MASHKKLKELCEIRKGKKVSSTRDKIKGSTPYLLIDTLRGKEPELYTADHNFTEAKETDLLMVFDGANSGLVSTGLKGAVGSTIGRIRSDPNLSNKYLSYFLKFNFQLLNKDTRGSAIPHVKPKELLELEIRYPSFEEQTLIVQEIEKHLTRLDAAVASLKTIKQKLGVYRKSVLNSAIGFRSYQTKKLNEVCLKIQDGTHFSPKEQFSERGKDRYLYITSRNIRNPGLDLEKVSYVPKETFEEIYKRCDPKKGDVLLTKDGANTGNVCINTLDEPFALLSSVALIRGNPSRVMNEYIRYFFTSPKGFYSITGSMTGTAIKRIILRSIKSGEIPLPEIKEQKKIIENIESKLSIIDKLEETIDTSLKKAEMLRKSILKAAFEGKLVQYEKAVA